MSSPLHVIELLGLLVAGWELLRRLRDGRWPALLTLVAAGWLAEETAMSLYRYYGYAEGWRLWLNRTPVAVAVIWPLVVLSSVEVVQRVLPWRERTRGWPHGRAAAVVGLLVIYDALVIEPVATRVGLWWWRAGSYFGVPLLGVAGWGVFGAVAALLLGLARLERHPLRGLWLAPLIAAATHAVLAPPVFLVLRLGWRAPFGPRAHAWAVGLLGLLLCPVALRLRPLLAIRLRDLSVKVAGSAIFFATVYGLRLWPFALFCSSVPLPYLCLTLFRPAAGPSSPPAPTVRHKE